jgi:hypothetical protein
LRFPIELTVNEVRRGNRRTSIGIVRDISARKAAEEQLQDLIHQLAASSQELESMMTAQVTSTNQVMATTQQIAATSEELVQTMQGVTGMAADTATAAEGRMGRSAAWFVGSTPVWRTNVHSAWRRVRSSRQVPSVLGASQVWPTSNRRSTSRRTGCMEVRKLACVSVPSRTRCHQWNI